MWSLSQCDWCPYGKKRHQECPEESPSEDTMRKQLTASQRKRT